MAQQTQRTTPGDTLVSAVRQATAEYRDLDVAMAAGYGMFHGCVSGPQDGAMGAHFVNGDLVGDGELDAARPEALLYEPRAGQLRLAGVEYVVLADAWNAAHDTPPMLMGQVFQYVGAPNRYRLPAFYELHVWAWKHNPSGTFSDWNPLVSCDDFTADAMMDLSPATHGSH
ncbi:MAG: hypothetical protein KBD01_13700 [Acidobacteria bacterium]|nr:hypothetical protein [Acidobacteriota bacterium]